jgi:transposase InsO family protein
MALERRSPNAGLLHHSDRGSTYASEEYRRGLRNITPIGIAISYQPPHDNSTLRFNGKRSEHP